MASWWIEERMLLAMVDDWFTTITGLKKFGFVLEICLPGVRVIKLLILLCMSSMPVLTGASKQVDLANIFFFWGWGVES